MKRLRARVVVGVPLLLWGGLVGACSKENAAIDRGGECFFASDCAPGLVCVEQRNKTRICTDDLTGVAGEPPDQGGGEDGGGEGGEDGEPVEGGTTDGPVTLPDTGADTNNPIDTGIDTGIKLDAGADG